MSKRASGSFKSVETWTIRNDRRDPKVTDQRITVVKIAVRESNGRFLGATNFKDKV